MGPDLDDDRFLALNLGLELIVIQANIRARNRGERPDPSLERPCSRGIPHRPGTSGSPCASPSVDVRNATRADPPDVRYIGQYSFRNEGRAHFRNAGGCWPSSVQIRSKSSEFGRIRAEVGRHRADDKFDRCRPNLDRARAKLQRIRPSFGRRRPTFAKPGPGSAWPGIGRTCLMLSRCRPTLGRR